MAATMHDVARLAGVSIKTVSNVVNDYPYVRESTRARVLAAIDELGYQINAAARNLRTGRTGMIALALPELGQSYYAELADSIIAAAGQRGLTVLIELTGGSREREIEVLSGARLRQTDGLIFTPIALSEGDEHLVDVEYPIVVLGERMFPDAVDHVTMQNVEAARAATQHLLDLGRRRIALIGVRPERMGTSRLRLTGYRQALEEAGVTFDERLLGASMEWQRFAGASAMAALLDAGAAPDAVFAMNDVLALGALHELQLRRIRVPDDVAVIGFDATDEGAYSNPTLSTVDPDREAIATTAVTYLLERLSGDAGRPPRRVFTDFRVLARGTTVAGRV